MTISSFWCMSFSKWPFLTLRVPKKESKILLYLSESQYQIFYEKLFLCISLRFPGVSFREMCIFWPFLTTIWPAGFAKTCDLSQRLESIKFVMNNYISLQICCFWWVIFRGMSNIWPFWPSLTLRVLGAKKSKTSKRFRKCDLTKINATMKFLMQHYVSLQMFSLQLSFYY